MLVKTGSVHGLTYGLYYRGLNVLALKFDFGEAISLQIWNQDLNLPFNLSTPHPMNQFSFINLPSLITMCSSLIACQALVLYDGRVGKVNYKQTSCHSCNLNGLAHIPVL